MNTNAAIKTKDVTVYRTENDVENKDTICDHCHDTYEILYLESGRGSCRIEGNEVNLLPRTILIIKPFQYHFVKIDKKEKFSKYTIHFSVSSSGESSVDFEEKFNLKGIKSGAVYYPECVSQSVVSIFDRFKNAESLPEKEADLYSKLLISEMLLLLSVEQNRAIAQDEISLGARIAAYINEYIDKTITLDILAKKFFISKYHLCRVFKEYSGVSAHSYINYKRVMYAKQLIDSGELASVAAYKVGFCDYSAFYRAYVRIVGKSPTQNVRKAEKISENKI